MKKIGTAINFMSLRIRAAINSISLLMLLVGVMHCSLRELLLGDINSHRENMGCTKFFIAAGRYVGNPKIA